MVLHKLQYLLAGAVGGHVAAVDVDVHCVSQPPRSLANARSLVGASAPESPPDGCDSSA